MKPFRQCAFFFAVLVVLASALPAVALAAQVQEKEGVGVAEFTIVCHRFRIPKAYLTQQGDMAGRMLEDWGDAVFMRGLMPDLRSFTKHENRLYYTGGLSKRPVSFGIWSRHDVKFFGPDPYYFRAETLKHCAEADMGYRVCPPEYPFRNETREFFVRDDADNRFVFECTRQGTAPLPHCYINLQLIDDVELRIGFQRKDFSRKEEIIRRVYSIVCGY